MTIHRMSTLIWCFYYRLVEENIDPEDALFIIRAISKTPLVTHLKNNKLFEILVQDIAHTHHLLLKRCKIHDDQELNHQAVLSLIESSIIAQYEHADKIGY